jgi:hypothetical protein
MAVAMAMQCKPRFEMLTGADGNAGGNAVPIVANANTNAYCNFHCNIEFYVIAIALK